MTKKGLADLVGVTPNTIFRYDAGEISPSDDTLQRIAQALAFPVKFFSGEEISEPRRDNASFRGMASKSGRTMDAALASGALAFLLDDWLERDYSRPDPDLLNLQNESAETAAMLVRQYWRLGDKPIENMVHLLELKGVRVFSLAENTLEVDAFSLWRDGVPYIFLNRLKSAERSRFDAAHELGHLCLHRHGGAGSNYVESNVEKEANDFAGAFLMPESDMRYICQRPMYSVSDLAEYKQRWRVSVSAINYRLRELDIISDARCNSSYVEMSRRGWLKREPNSIPREQSSTLQDMMNDLRSRGISKTKIATEINVPPSEIEVLLFGLTNMLALDGAGAVTPRCPVDLKVVSRRA